MSKDVNNTKNTKDTILSKMLYFIPAFVVVIMDQIVKAIIASNMQLYERKNIIGDFISFFYVRNKNAGFSVGENFPPFLRTVVLYILPVLLIFGVAYMLYCGDKYDIKTKVEKLSLSFIIGGGLGNIIDRIFRPEGVVDFISVKLPFLKKWGGYWPTFNIADSFVVIGVVLLLIWSLFVTPIKVNKQYESENKKEKHVSKKQKENKANKNNKNNIGNKKLFSLSSKKKDKWD